VCGDEDQGGGPAPAEEPTAAGGRETDKGDWLLGSPLR